MNGPADSEVDYKKKYRNLKRKLKFLIYVRDWGRGGVSCRGVLGPLTDHRPLSAHLDCDTGTRVLSGGTEEGTEEVAEGVPRQEVRRWVEGRGREGRLAGNEAPLAQLSDPIREWGHKMHDACPGAVARIQRAS